jgi:hypothetical protein
MAKMLGAIPPTIPSDEVQVSPPMKLFVSWSGERSKAVASAFKHWLPDVFPGIEVWMSDHDIQAGSRWGTELEKILGECKLGVICLTRESLKSHWLTFEAGALSTAMTGSRVIPYLFQLRSPDVSPPLSQFQPVSADGEGTYKLLRSINDAFDKTMFDEERLKRVFSHWWPDLMNQLKEIEQHTEAYETAELRSDRDILEEILEMMRERGIRGLSGILNQILSIPNVRRIEVSKKIIAGSSTNALAVQITVEKKLPIDQIPKDQLIPKTIFGMPTDVVEGAFL